MTGREPTTDAPPPERPRPDTFQPQKETLQDFWLSLLLVAATSMLCSLIYEFLQRLP